MYTVDNSYLIQKLYILCITYCAILIFLWPWMTVIYKLKILNSKYDIVKVQAIWKVLYCIVRQILSIIMRESICLTSQLVEMHKQHCTNSKFYCLPNHLTIGLWKESCGGHWQCWENKLENICKQSSTNMILYTWVCFYFGEWVKSYQIVAGCFHAVSDGHVASLERLWWLILILMLMLILWWLVLNCTTIVHRSV